MEFEEIGDINSFELDMYAPEKAGVYMLFKENFQINNLIYAGSAENIKAAIQAHLSPEEKNKCLISRIDNHIIKAQYVLADEKTKREKYHSEILTRYKPVCNDK